MMDILEEIVAHKRIEIDQRRRFIPAHQLYTLVEQKIHDDEANHQVMPSLKESLLQSSTGIIAEFKRRSPSKGWINQGAKASEVPLAYQQNGAAALSILTDIDYFGGYDEYIQEARATGVTLPILYKNFIIDEYQLFQARYCGASAVLLIAAILSREEYHRYLEFAHQLGLEVLLEVHTEQELSYADFLPDALGVNNRNLGTFVTDVQNSVQLIEKMPDDCCRVSESGIDNPAIVRELRSYGYQGFLMGEHFMRSHNPGEALQSFIQQI